jgi:hypothetical protein
MAGEDAGAVLAAAFSEDERDQMVGGELARSHRVRLAMPPDSSSRAPSHTGAVSGRCGEQGPGAAISALVARS